MDIDNAGGEGPYFGVPLSAKRARLLYEHSRGSRPWGGFDSGRETATKNYVKRSIAKNQELKYHITSFNTVEAAYDNPILSALCNPIQGDGIDQRLGDALKPKSIELRGLIVSQDTTLYQRGRVVVFQWHQDSTPQLDNVMGPDSATPSATTVWDGYSVEQRGNYRVLYDSGPINLGFISCNTTDRSRIINIKIKKKMRPIQFYSAGTAGRGQIYAAVYSSAADADNAVYFMGECVVYYNDKA